MKPNPAWKKTRETHLRVYPECRRCGDLDDPVVHHIRYRGKRGESEKPGDLVTLCRSCHDQLHRLGPRPVPSLEKQPDFIDLLS